MKQIDVHELKTWPVPFWDVVSGTKTFEVRRNDRDFKVGDYLVLKEYDPNTEKYSGEEITVQIDYSIVLPEPDGFVGMVIKEVKKELVIEQHNDDTVTIEGTRYSADFFREFGYNFPNMIGRVLRIDKKENGVVTVTRLFERETDNK